MSFKNEKEYKKERDRWRSGPLRQRSPAGYKRFLANEKEWKNRSNNSSSNNDEMKVNKSKSDNKSDFDAGKYRERDEQHTKNMDALIKKAEGRLRPETQDIKPATPLTSNDLPKRPKRPQMPSISIPGGILNTEKVARPSGKVGASNSGIGETINKYSIGEKSDRTLRSEKQYGANAPIKGMSYLRDRKGTIKRGKK